MKEKGVCIVSGGIDSCVVAYDMVKTLGLDVNIITFDYGQKHKKEIDYARLIAAELECNWEKIILPLGDTIMSSSSLTGHERVPEGHYAEENMRSTVVPNRNTIMLSIAWSYACSVGAKWLGCGVHAGDHFIYPDCRPEFIRSLEKSFKLATIGHGGEYLNLFTPLLNFPKDVIIRRGSQLGVDFEKTWTCYNGRKLSCGKCGSCDERKTAFEEANMTDPLEYENE